MQDQKPQMTKVVRALSPDLMHNVNNWRERQSRRLTATPITSPTLSLVEIIASASTTPAAPATRAGAYSTDRRSPRKSVFNHFAGVLYVAPNGEETLFDTFESLTMSVDQQASRKARRADRALVRQAERLALAEFIAEQDKLLSTQQAERVALRKMSAKQAKLVIAQQAANQRANQERFVQLKAAKKKAAAARSTTKSSTSSDYMERRRTELQQRETARLKAEKASLVKRFIRVLPGLIQGLDVSPILTSVAFEATCSVKSTLSTTIKGLSARARKEVDSFLAAFIAANNVTTQTSLVTAGNHFGGAL